MQTRKCKLCDEQGKGHYYYVSKTSGVKKEVFVCKRCRDRIDEIEERWEKASEKAQETRKAKRDT
jgi:ribosome-binding protein aMBF1 (putative translation factor)